MCDEYSEVECLQYIHGIFLGPLSLPRSSQSPGEPRNKRLRRLSSTEEEMDLGTGRDKGTGEVAYYGQSPASLSSQTSWHSDVDHGGLDIPIFVLLTLLTVCIHKVFLLQFGFIQTVTLRRTSIQRMPCPSRWRIICTLLSFFSSPHFHFSDWIC